MIEQNGQNRDNDGPDPPLQGRAAEQLNCRGQRPTRHVEFHHRPGHEENGRHDDEEPRTHDAQRRAHHDGGAVGDQSRDVRYRGQQADTDQHTDGDDQQELTSRETQSPGRGARHQANPHQDQWSAHHERHPQAGQLGGVERFVLIEGPESGQPHLGSSKPGHNHESLGAAPHGFGHVP